MRVIQVILIVLSVMIFTGCKVEDRYSRIRCSPEQLVRVDKQMDICKRTKYYMSHCYDQAREELCDILSQSPLEVKNND